MIFILHSFDELSPQQIEDIFRLRQRVFIIEQTCFYEDIDGYDRQANHLLMYEQNELAGYLRIFEPGIKYQEWSLGRIVVDKKFRGKGVGEQLIKEGIRHCGGGPVRIEAQAHLQTYYEQFGFSSEGEIYPVDGINHIQMVRSGS